jgi:hypothetical protein
MAFSAVSPPIREGFRPHIIVAIERAYREGKLDAASVFSEISGDARQFR